MRRSRKKWRERLHLSGNAVAVILVFVMVTTVNCGDEESTTRTYVYTNNENPAETLQQVPSQLSSALSPQNFMSGNPTNFMSGPANMFPGAQNLFSNAASFFPGAQTFMSGPSSFVQAPQNFMQPSNFLSPGQSFMSGDNPGAAMMAGKEIFFHNEFRSSINFKI